MALETTLARQFQKALRAKALGITIEEYEEGLRNPNYFKQLNFIKSWEGSENVENYSAKAENAKAEKSNSTA